MDKSKIILMDYESREDFRMTFLKLEEVFTKVETRDFKAPRFKNLGAFSI